MKALSIKQPWAARIAEGVKTIETRSWKTSYRGPVLVCVSKAMDWEGMGSVGSPYHSSKTMNERGRAIAVAQLVDVRPMTAEDEAAAQCPCLPGLFAWVLKSAVRINSFPVKGKLGLFEVPYNP
jgi:hypothetical protein